MKNNYPAGVSVIVCCFNSASRIVQTLTALANQRCDQKVPWEIIVVDNNCTDNTTVIVEQTWNDLKTTTDLRIVVEPSPGLANAREKGISAAKFSIIVFCDDDNWLSENYLLSVFDILQSDSSIAACGGMGVPVFETEEPFWFYKYSEAFALGSQEINEKNGRLLNLYGAGLAINKSILDELKNGGFNQILKGRTGENLSSAEDTELSYAFVLLGYRLYCADDLKFFHYLPKERLTFDYLKKLFIAFGNDGPVRNLYNAYLNESLLHQLIKNWWFHFALSLFRLFKYMIFPPKKYGRSIYLGWSIAYIKQLLTLHKCYDKIKKQVESIKKIKSSAEVNNIASKSTLYFETN